MENVTVTRAAVIGGTLPNSAETKRITHYDKKNNNNKIVWKQLENSFESYSRPEVSIMD